MDQELAQSHVIVCKILVTPSLRSQYNEYRSESLARKLYSILTDSNQSSLCQLQYRIQENKISLRKIEAFYTDNVYIVLECQLENDLDAQKLNLLVQSKEFDKILSSMQDTSDLDKQINCDQEGNIILQARVIADVTERVLQARSDHINTQGNEYMMSKDLSSTAKDADAQQSYKTSREGNVGETTENNERPESRTVKEADLQQSYNTTGENNSKKTTEYNDRPESRPAKDANAQQEYNTSREDNFGETTSNNDRLVSTTVKDADSQQNYKTSQEDNLSETTENNDRPESITVKEANAQQSYKTSREDKFGETTENIHTPESSTVKESQQNYKTLQEDNIKKTTENDDRPGSSTVKEDEEHIYKTSRDDDLGNMTENNTRNEVQPTAKHKISDAGVGPLQCATGRPGTSTASYDPSRPVVFGSAHYETGPIFTKLYRVHLYIEPKYISKCLLHFREKSFSLRNINGTSLWETYIAIDNKFLFENFSFSISYEDNSGYLLKYFKKSVETIRNLVDKSGSPYVYILIGKPKKDSYKIEGMLDIVEDIITRVSLHNVREGLLQICALKDLPKFDNDTMGVIFSSKRIEWKQDITKNFVQKLLTRLENAIKNEHSAVVFCYLLSIIKANSMISTFLMTENAWSLFQLSRNVSEENIPPVCKTDVLNVLKAIFKYVLKDRASIVLFVEHIHRTFPTDVLAPFVITWLEKRETCSTSYSPSVEFLIMLFDKGLSEENMTLLNIIVKLITRDLLLKFLEEAILQNAEWLDCMKPYVSELHLKNAQAFLRLASEHDLTGVLNMWVNITSTKFGYNNEVVTKAERAIYACLENSNNFERTDVLVSIIEHKELFNQPQKIIKVMTIISKSKCKEIRECMFELLNVETLVSLCEDEKAQSVVQDWARNVFHSERGDSFLKFSEDEQQKNIRTIYLKHNKITKTRFVCHCEGIKMKLHDLVFDMIQQCSFKVLAQVLSEVENDEEISETFGTHIRNLLRNRHFGEKPNAMIHDLCGKDRLIAHSKAIVKLVLDIVETMDIKVNESSTLDTFERLLECSNFWMKVISATGRKIKDVHEHSVVKAVTKTIQDTLRNLLEKNISCKFIIQIQKEEKQVIEIFSIISNKPDVQETLTISINRLKQFLNFLNIIEETFHNVKTSHIAKLQPITTFILDYIGKQKRAILQGDTTMAELFMPKSKLIDEMSSFCLDIRNATSSVVFWNAMKTVQEETPDMMRECAHLSKCIDSESVLEIDDENVDRFKSAAKKCLQHYRLVWLDFANDMNQRISETRKVFYGIKDMNLEIEKAEQICNIKLPDSSRNSLIRFWNMKTYSQTVELIKVAAKAFKFRDSPDSVYTQTVVQFENMLKGNVSDRTLKEITPLLDQVHNIQDIISHPLKEVLETVKESSALLDFLREVIDEDIRNLIDAVEEHSEQYVRESTVSDLIEIKRFFHPVLKANFTTNVGSMFILLQQQIDETKINQIPVKMHSCRDNLHSLRALYQNVANRGEHTVELISNIMHKGVFHFSLNKRSCEILVLYEQDKKDYRHTAADLDDLRSRALLIMNADKKGNDKDRDDRKENLDSFVKVVDNAFEVYNISMKLRQSGHFEFSVYDTKCQKDKMAELRTKLHQIYQTWISEVEYARKEYYFMNFLISDQLFDLYAFLNKDIQNDEVIISTLKYMNISSANLNQLSTIYRMFPLPRNYQETLENMGKTLDRLYSDTVIPAITRLGDASPTTMLEKVLPGKPFIAWLDEGSSLVIRTLLALYLNTTNAIPMAYQVLFCREETTFDEIDLLIKRCLLNKKHSKPQLFSIINVENLRQDVQIFLHNAICILPSGDFLLCLICRGNESHPFLVKFTDHVRRLAPISESQMSACLKKHCSYVTVVTSDVPGAGKTEFIQNKAISENKRSICWHISGQLNRKLAIEELQQLKLKPYHVLHIDIASVTDPFQLDLMLFELMFLKYIAAGSTAYALECETVYIEIANTVKQTLCNALPNISYFFREHIKWRNYEDIKVSSEINSPMQVVCTYLKSLDDRSLDIKDIYFSGPKAVRRLENTECQTLLQKHFSTSGDLSYTVVNIFVRILADQLKKLSSSSFFRTSSLQAMLGDVELLSVKSNLVTALLKISKDFSSRSVHSCRSTQAAFILGNANEEGMNVAEILADRVSGMIRWEDSNHLVILFHQSNQSVSALYRNVHLVPPAIHELFESQVKSKLTDFQHKTTDELENLLVMLIRRSNTVESSEVLVELRRTYALTPDNLLKMVLISLRINANIPVLIMGETGCGKTSLIRYLGKISGVEFEVFSIHAGIRACQVQEKLATVHAKARKNLKTQYWLFLDEINTCDHLGLISIALCHRRAINLQLSPNLILIAACNPYRLRTENTIFTAGLQGKVKSDDLSRLVYRVHPLPESLVDFVWDFGSLSDKDEDIYIKKMSELLALNAQFNELLGDVIAMSQKFVRRNEANDYCVSLRDVDRCRKIIQWLDTFLKTKNNEISDDDRCLKSIILGLSVCYHSRFSDSKTRQQYREEMQKCFTDHNFNITEHYIQSTILNEQKDIIKKMEYLPEGTALNVALQENVFMLLVCILNKIPIFLVGKPGCSKSLSMQLIRSNLRGKDSTDPLFKSMPQLFCVSFQGSESSTSDGVIKVFEKARKYQQHNDEKDVLSVVILDEIGLAEISRFNPLKVLHGLIEPEDGKPLNIAVVGISNWALDAAKMNRAIHLSRPDMGLEDLKLTGQSIGESMMNIEEEKFEIASFPLKSMEFYLDESMKQMLDGISSGYYEYCSKSQKFPNFHGLRDFYSLTKYIARRMNNILNADKQEKSNLLLIGILRNFGGLPTERNRIVETFRKHLPEIDPLPIPVMQLIHENITDRTSRHLMLITNGDVVISVLERELNDMGIEFDIIFGSNFEEDLKEDYSYRILSRIILCMERGMVLILKNLESIYGSLYDMLNQNYTIVGKKKNCRVALGHYSNPMCHVHDDFKCIVLVEESKLDYSDPPFLNRFEKQQFEFTDLLETESLQQLVKNLETEISDFCKIPNYSFSPQDIIPSYSQDLLVSLVLRAKKMLEEDVTINEIRSFARKNLLWLFPPEVVIRAEASVLSKTNAALTGDMIKDFMGLPVHRGIGRFHDYITKSCHASLEQPSDKRVKCCIVYTYSSIHTDIEGTFHEETVKTLKMAFFKSEKQFAAAIEDFFQAHVSVLLIQCSAVTDMQNILLSKVIIEKHIRHMFEKETYETNKPLKFMYIVIHLERNSNRRLPLNFLSDWKILFLDVIHEPTNSLDHFVHVDKLEIIQERRPLNTYITDALFWVFSSIKFASQVNSVDNLEYLLNKLRLCTYAIDVLETLIVTSITKNTRKGDSTKWYVDVAKNAHELLKSGTLIGAIENTIKDFIKKPLAMYIFKLLEINLLSPVFTEDRFADARRKVWKKYVCSTDHLNLDGIPSPSGPECYTCSSEFLMLKMPYSQEVCRAIAERKDEFLVVIRRIRMEKGLDIEDEIPSDIFDIAIQACEQIVCFDTVDSEDFFYDGRNDDYLHDFSNLYSFKMSTWKDEQKRISVFQWALSHFINLTKLKEREFRTLVSSLHATIWVYGSVIEAVFPMAELPSSPIDLSGKFADKPNLQLEDPGTEVIYLSIGVDVDNTDIDQLERDNVHSAKMDTYLDSALQKTDIQSDVSIESLKDRATFVKEISLSLLPTTDVLKHYSLDQWLAIVMNILPFARVVYSDSKELISLKLCQEIVETFFELDLTCHEFICPIADSLLQSQGSIEVKEVCQIIFETLHPLRNHVKTVQPLQRLFCSYISRCLTVNPENEYPLKFALDKIVSDTIFDPSLNFFGQILRFALILDSPENEKIFVDLLSDDTPEPTTPFCLCLNECIKSLNADKKSNVCFLVLLADIIEKFAFNEELDEDNVKQLETSSDVIFRRLSMANNVLAEGHKSLNTLVAIAYIRKFLKIFIVVLESVKFDCSVKQVLANSINGLFYHKDNAGFAKQLSSELIHLFLKMLENAFGQENIDKICRKIDKTVDSLSHINWDKSFIADYPVYNPLRLHVNEHLYSEYRNEIFSIGGKDNKLSTMLDSSEDCAFCILCLTVQKFYMAKCIQDSTDNEKRAAIEIYKIVQTSGMAENVKQFVAHLVGANDNDFKHSLFNLSAMIESPIPQVVSVMLHLSSLIIVSASDKNVWHRAMFSPQTLQITLPKLPKLFQSILNILYYSCLTCSYGLELSTPSEIEKLYQTENAHEHLKECLLCNWTHLHDMLKLNYNDICLMMHEVIFRATHLFTHQSAQDFDEHLIAKHIDIIADTVVNRIEVIQRLKEKYLSSTANDLQKCVLEIKSCSFEGDFKNAASLFRVTDLPTKSILVSEIQARFRQQYPFLNIVVVNMEKLQIPQYISSFLKWHVSVVSCGTYKFRKMEFRDMTVAQFCSKFEDESKKSLLENSFKAFADDWNTIGEKLFRHLKEINESLSEMDLMHKGVKMPNCAILDDNSLMLKILEAMVHVQNTFLLESNKSVGDGSSLIQTQLQNVTKKNLINFQWEDDWLDYCQCDTQYGLGKKLNFYFENMESDMKRAILFEKTLIEIKRPLATIIFTDNLFQNSINLLREIEMNIKQTYISSNIQKAIESKKERDISQINELLSHTGMTLSLLRKTGAGASPDTQLINYLQEWQTVTGMSSNAIKALFPEDVRIGQIVDLYQWLEEVNGGNMVDSLERKYRTSLDKISKEHLTRARQSNMQFLEKLEHPLKVFVHRIIGTVDCEISCEQPLVDHIINVDLWWRNEFKDGKIIADGSTIPLESILSPLILVENIYELMNFISDAIKDSTQASLPFMPQKEKPVEAPKQLKQKVAKKLMKR